MTETENDVTETVIEPIPVTDPATQLPAQTSLSDKIAVDAVAAAVAGIVAAHPELAPFAGMITGGVNTLIIAGLHAVANSDVVEEIEAFFGYVATELADAFGIQ